MNDNAHLHISSNLKISYTHIMNIFINYIYIQGVSRL